MRRAMVMAGLLCGAGCGGGTTAATQDLAMVPVPDMTMVPVPDMTMADPNCPNGFLKLSTKNFGGVYVGEGAGMKYTPPKGDPWLANITAPKMWTDSLSDGTKMGTGKFELAIDGKTITITGTTSAAGDNGNNMGVTISASALDFEVELCDSRSPNKMYTLTFDCTGMGMGSSQADVPTAQAISGMFGAGKLHCSYVSASNMWVSPAGTKSFTATADAMGKAKALFQATSISNGGGINGAGNSSMKATYKLSIQ